LKGKQFVAGVVVGLVKNFALFVAQREGRGSAALRPDEFLIGHRFPLPALSESDSQASSESLDFEK
jgi:hypothetical protein